MSETTNDASDATGPAFPGFWRFTWLLFMQPLKLHDLFKAWDLDRDSSFVELWSRWRGRDPIVRSYVSQMATLLFVATPALTFGMCELLQVAGVAVDWANILFGVFLGVFLGVSFGVSSGVFLGVSFGVSFGVFLGVFLGVSFGVSFGVFLGVSFGVFLGVFLGVSFGVSSGVSFGVFLGVSFGVSLGIDEGWLSSLLIFVIFISAFSSTYFRLPFYVLEAGWSGLIVTCVRLGLFQRGQVARLLPLHYHDFIYVELPGLRTFIVDLAAEDEDAAQDLIATAATSIGQKRAARFALAELQARGLERAARGRLYVRVADLDLPFLPSETDDVLRPFQSAAEDLRAAETSNNQFHRRRVLDRAERSLHGAVTAIAQKRRPDHRERRFQPVHRLWLDIVSEEKARLAREESESPQVPIPFVVGAPLEQTDGGVFRGRADLVRIIDHDLVGDRRSPILLVGQRRMGKSSLLNMLPVQLGTGTRIVPIDFQGLSGSKYRDRPHQWIAESVAAVRPGTSPPSSDAWGETLDWLREVDAALVDDDLRLLIALDEIERLEDGIRAGWATSDFLDFVRAAGDALHRIRFLLVTAYPLPRLGPHWVDRLINVLQRRIGPLSPVDAEALIREPIPDFPDIYPEDGVRRIVAATSGHPYLVQLVCDGLCRRLNDDGRFKAIDEDVEAAIDDAILDTPLFDELWRQRDDDEKRVLRRLASGEDAPDEAHGVVRRLEREGYVVGRGSDVRVAVPMFADWIVEQG